MQLDPPNNTCRARPFVVRAGSCTPGHVAVSVGVYEAGAVDVLARRGSQGAYENMFKTGEQLGY